MIKLALYLIFIAAVCGSVLAEEDKIETKSSRKIIAKVDRTKEFADLVGGRFRQFSTSTTNCFQLSKEDHQAGRNIAKHSFSPGELKCSIVFEKGATFEESQLCSSDILEYVKVTEAVKDDGTFSYSLKVEKTHSSERDRPDPRIVAIVCDAPRSAIEDPNIMADLQMWNSSLSATQIELLSAPRKK
jgi:hypothetical protein